MSLPHGPTGGAGRRRGGAGFSLIETALAVVLVALGVVALVISARSGTQANAAGRELTQATYLAQEIREWTLKLPFSDPDPADQGNPPGPDGSDPQDYVDDLDDLMDITYSPPRDGDGYAVYDMNDWSQHITVEWKDPDSLTTTVAPGTTDVVRVCVDIARGNKPILNVGWLVTRRESE